MSNLQYYLRGCLHKVTEWSEDFYSNQDNEKERSIFQYDERVPANTLVVIFIESPGILTSRHFQYILDSLNLEDFPNCKNLFTAISKIPKDSVAKSLWCSPHLRKIRVEGETMEGILEQIEDQLIRVGIVPQKYYRRWLSVPLVSIFNEYKLFR